jgi:hypothetical protein
VKEQVGDITVSASKPTFPYNVRFSVGRVATVGPLFFEEDVLVNVEGKAEYADAIEKAARLIKQEIEK